jgi:hypothetical protein
MGFTEEIDQEIKGQPEKKWEFFHRTMAEIGDKEEQEEFTKALNNPAIPISAISSVLKKRGIGVSHDTLRRWRNDLRR